MKSEDDSVVDNTTRSFGHVEICYMQEGNGSAPGSGGCPVAWNNGPGCGFAYFDLSEWPARVLKLVKDFPEDEPELYEILADPYEQANLASANPDVVDKLLAARDSIRKPSCPAEDQYDERCFRSKCNRYGRKKDCRSDSLCEWSSDGFPYRCSLRPTPAPSPRPSATKSPTGSPSFSPTLAPSGEPTEMPTEAPSESPSTTVPSGSPSSLLPSAGPSASPSLSPSAVPTLEPSASPSGDSRPEPAVGAASPATHRVPAVVLPLTLRGFLRNMLT
mmetsp:Transcript_13078/g.33384  ORF Transcript_13078/g.33384 Transcript_13078/m.33384 type:complete len:275 (-) Transcript_13078:731-1555(-)